MSWPMVKLSTVCTLINGRAYAKDELLSEGKYEVLRVGNFFSNRDWYYSDLELPEDKYCDHGDLLYAWSASFGPRIWDGKKVIYHYHIWKIVIDEMVADKKYLFYALQNDVESIKREQGTGSTMIHVTKSAMEDRLIPLPPLAEQKRITAILDKADAIRRKRQQAIQLADDFLRAVFLEMFGDPVTNPKGWNVRPLHENIAHANNGLSRRRKKPDNVGEIVLRLQDVHYDGIRFEKDLNRIRLEDSEKQRFLVNKGDILFVRVNGNPDYVGRSAVFEGFKEDVYHNDHLIRMKVGDAYHPVFLSYCLNHEAGRRKISGQIKTSAGQHTISQGGIGALEFYAPPLAIQKKFVCIRNAVVNIPFAGDVPFDMFASLSQRAFSGQL